MSFNCKKAGLRMNCFWLCGGAPPRIQRFGGRDVGLSCLFPRMATWCEPESRHADRARYRQSPNYNGRMLRHPSVRLRMDFPAPNIVGTFVCQCQLLIMRTAA
jgi:hypothetical protein